MGDFYVCLCYHFLFCFLIVVNIITCYTMLLGFHGVGDTHTYHLQRLLLG